MGVTPNEKQFLLSDVTLHEVAHTHAFQYMYCVYCCTGVRRNKLHMEFFYTLPIVGKFRLAFSACNFSTSFN